LPMASRTFLSVMSRPARSFLEHALAFAGKGVFLGKNEVGKNKSGKNQKTQNPKVHHLLIPTG